MGNLVVKDNALIEASYRLNEVEQRLVLLAILKARELGDNVEQLQGRELILHANDYIQHFGVERNAAYESLKKAILGLFMTKWSYKYVNKNGNVAVRHERFIQSAEYIKNEATVKFVFSSSIIPMLMELEKSFTTYAIEQVAQLSSSYAMRLYEFFMQHFDKATGKGWLEISLADLRFRFGLLPNEYSLMGDFKRRVLDYSIKQINDKTDLAATYVQRKQGRLITGFRFEFKRKRVAKSRKRDEHTLDLFDGLTDLERTAIQGRITEHVARLEAKGEIVGDFHRRNITAKAVAERWGVDVAEKNQKREQALKAKQAKEQAKQQVEQERKRQAREKIEKQQQEIIAKFESLTHEQQERILDAVRHEQSSTYKQVFAELREKGIAHKSPLFARALAKQLNGKI